MTTENDFQALLDADPKDHQTRTIFADWLDERDDPRADGYRALGVLARHPVVSKLNDKLDAWYWRQSTATMNSTGYHCTLPADWFDLLPRDNKYHSTMWPIHTGRQVTRKEVEDAAALAFAKLPRRRKLQLLSLEPAGAK